MNVTTATTYAIGMIYLSGPMAKAPALTLPVALENELVEVDIDIDSGLPLNYLNGETVNGTSSIRFGITTL